MTEPWKTKHWFTSPWNFHKEVTDQCHFPERIEIHDVSLRDGEQQAGLIFSADEKLRLAEKMAEVGIQRIEAGMPAVSPQDAEAIKRIVKAKLGPKTFCFARCMVDDVKRAADCGVDGIVVEIPSSEHIIEYAYRWPLQRAIDLSISATQCAKENGLYTVFFPIDFTRADINWVLDLITKVATEGHMDALAVVDTFGGLKPHTVPYLIGKIKERIDKPLETHFHEDFGLGAANTIMALAAGAEVAHTTITGIGERAGNTPYEDVALALKCMYDKDIGLKAEKFCELSKLMRDISGMPIPPNRPIVGDTLFNIESGIIISWLKNLDEDKLLELTPFHPDLVGQKPPEPILGKNSGIDSVAIFLEQLGIKASQEEMESLVREVKERSYQLHRTLTMDDFKALVGKK